MKFSDQRLDGSEFKNCSLANAVFDDVNLSGARLTNVKRHRCRVRAPL